MNIYYEFWSKALGLTLQELTSDKLVLSTSGAYVQKHAESYMFLYSDLGNGKKVLAGSPSQIEKISAAIPEERLSTLSAERFRTASPFQAMTLEFQDIDYGLHQPASFRPVSFCSEKLKILPLTKSHQAQVDAFYSLCSEDDQDTLDLTFDNEFVLGLCDDQRIIGISRFAPIRTCPQLADVTVLIAPHERGRGLSTALVSRLIEEMLARGLYPKYRVAEDNRASIAVAERLGLKPLFSLLTWKTS